MAGTAAPAGPPPPAPGPDVVGAEVDLTVDIGTS